MSVGKLKIESYDGEGLKRAVESGSWFVAIKNWKPANDVNGFDMLERHMQTDEVFVLLSGACTLLVDASPNDDASAVGCVKMEPMKVYCIPKGVWHNTITSKDAKLILMENRDTSMENSEIKTLSADEQAALRLKLAA
jgi:mannose-6-phosphate isomerase-like protein (cupin superfamily)